MSEEREKASGVQENKTEPVFPELNKPEIFYEDERFEIWFGVPLKNITTQMEFMAEIDRLKVYAMRELAKYGEAKARELAQREAEKKSPVIARLNSSLASVMRPIKEMILGGKTNGKLL